MSLVFYNTKATGSETFFDQILEFGAIQTDVNLKEIDRFEIGCRLLPHIVPTPYAMRVAGMKVSDLNDPSLPSHYEMVCAIRAKLISWSPALFIGWNSLELGEHLVRQALYKTLHKPYLTNSDGNSRSDVMRIVQACSVFAPDALQVPIGNDGQKVFVLDRIALANGSLATVRAMPSATLKRRFFSANFSLRARRTFGLPSCASAQKQPSLTT